MVDSTVYAEVGIGGVSNRMRDILMNATWRRKKKTSNIRVKSRLYGHEVPLPRLGRTEKLKWPGKRLLSTHADEVNRTVRNPT